MQVVDLPSLRRPATLTEQTLSHSHERWQILRVQIECGHEPCFQTDRRHACAEPQCRWHERCVTMRADWLR